MNKRAQHAHGCHSTETMAHLTAGVNHQLHIFCESPLFFVYFLHIGLILG